MQACSDILLGWLRSVGPDAFAGDYYVRQLHDWKGSADVQSMSPAVLADYGQSCGEVLARAHSRSGDRIAIAAYLGNGDAVDDLRRDDVRVSPPNTPPEFLKWLSRVPPKPCPASPCSI